MNRLRLLFAAVPLATILAGCGESPATTPIGASAEAASDPNAIVVDDRLFETLAIGAPARKTVRLSRIVAARIEADETRIARVSAPMTGRLTALDVVEGQQVVPGQRLAAIRSTELADEQFEYLKALSQRDLTARAVERAKQLLAAGVISEAELQRREAEAAEAAFELSAHFDQLRVLGMSDETVARLERTRTIDSTVPVLASIGGTVMERRFTNGQIAQAAETMFVIADLSQVWLVADVPEQSAGSLEPGREVEAEIAALPDRKWTGKLDFVSAIVDAETRTVRVRMTLKNSERRLKPAMLATMTIYEQAERERVVPATAIVREANADYVFVRTAPRTFELRPVTIGEEFGADRVLESGLRPDEEIVLDGAFHLNNERQRRLTQQSD